MAEHPVTMPVPSSPSPCQAALRLGTNRKATEGYPVGCRNTLDAAACTLVMGTGSRAATVRGSRTVDSRFLETGNGRLFGRFANLEKIQGRDI